MFAEALHEGFRVYGVFLYIASHLILTKTLGCARLLIPVSRWRHWRLYSLAGTKPEKRKDQWKTMFLNQNVGRDLRCRTEWFCYVFKHTQQLITDLGLKSESPESESGVSLLYRNTTCNLKTYFLFPCARILRTYFLVSLTLNLCLW